MKFLKILINSLISGLVFSALIALLVMNLNINISFDIMFFLFLTLFMTLIYGLLIMLACMAFFGIMQFFSGGNLKIALVSPGFLLVSLSFVLGLATLIFRENYHLFQSFFSIEVQNYWKTQIITLTFLFALGIPAGFGYLKYKKKIFFALIYFLLLGAGLAYTIMQRTRFPEPEEHRIEANLDAKVIDKKITIIGMEGLSYDFIIPLITEEKLPNFSWLMDGGSWGKLISFLPNEPLLLNSSFNTGKFPAKHRQISWKHYYLFNFEKPIEVNPRYIFFRQLTRLGILKSRKFEPPSYSKDIWKIFEAHQTPFLRLDQPQRSFQGEISPESETVFTRVYKDLRFETGRIFQIVKKSFCMDVTHELQAISMRESVQPQLSYLLLSGLNIAETFLYKYSFPDMYGTVDQEEIQKYGSMIERYYQYYDEIIGRAIAAKKDNELIVVFSPFGVEPLPVWKRYLEWILGNSDASAYHEKAPDGVVFFFGKEIEKGKFIDDMHLIDIAPTLLHYLGLPIGKDMDGIVNGEIFLNKNPVMYISSYEDHDIKN